MSTFKSKLALTLLLFTAGLAPVHGAELLSVRFGSHRGFDRLVCELSGPAKYEVTIAQDGSAELHLMGVSVGEKFFLPKLPSQIKLLTTVEAFREGDSLLILEIRGIEPLVAKAIELRGQSWRLALDLAKLSDQPAESADSPQDTVSTSKPTPKSPVPHDEPVPYVPGDRPIETKLAEDTKTNDSSNALVNPQMLAADSLKALGVLAEFHEALGDTMLASEFAKLYLTQRREIVAADQHGNSASLPLWVVVLLIVVSGMLGGFVGSHLRVPTGKLSLPKLRFTLPKFLKKKSEVAGAEDLEDDIRSLDRAVASEGPKPAKQPPKAEAKPEAKPAPKSSKKEKEVPQEVLDEAEQSFPADSEPETVEAAMKESLMDRRVTRVLELSAENKSLPEIAQELDMGQDEVKLILDLHSKG